jgi:hypothetical protein
MRHPMRVLALACALALTPACASLPLGEGRHENAAAQTLDQRAYAVLSAYAVVIEEATNIVRDPNAPPAFKRALGQAERAATPIAETLHIAIAAYLRARSDVNQSANAPRAAETLAIAARRLNEAIAAAQAPIGELEALLRAHRG